MSTNQPTKNTVKTTFISWCWFQKVIVLTIFFLVANHLRGISKNPSILFEAINTDFLIAIILKMYKYFSYLSLDVAIGAALLSASISKYLNGEFQWDFAICLGIAVWIIYTFDHLIDAHKSPEKPSISRHLFHKKHTRFLVVLIVIASVLGWVIVLDLPSNTILWGIILLGIVLVYFSLVFFFKQFYLKELLVAVVYTLGVFLGPMSVFSDQIELPILSLIIQLFLIAFVNLSLFSLIEYEQDEMDNHQSLARKIGEVKTSILIKIILIITIALQLISIIQFGFSFFQILFLMMTIMLTLVYLYSNILRKNEAYRWIADAVFFIPAIELLY